MMDHNTDIKPKIWSEEVDRIIAEGSDAELDSLRGTPGIRYEPITWQEISQYVKAIDVAGLSNVGRTPRDLRVYRNFKAEVLSKYRSLSDYVQKLVFEYPIAEGENGKLVVVKPQVVERRIIWRHSDFPYYLEDGLEHHIVWSTLPLADEELHEAICEHRQGWRYVCWVNPEALASIPAVWHAHVVSRRDGNVDSG